MNVQGQPPESGLHEKGLKNFASHDDVSENKIEVYLGKWGLALSRESGPQKQCLGRPLALFKTRTSKICTVKRTICASRGSNRLARKRGERNARIEYGNPR